MKYVGTLITFQARSTILPAEATLFVTRIRHNRQHVDGIFIYGIFESGSRHHKRAQDVRPSAVAGTFQRTAEHRAQTTHLVCCDNKTRLDEMYI